LTLAILRNDVREVEVLIDRSPECIEEVSFYGETPCFVAIEKLEILRLLVKRATPGQLLQPCRIASGMISPLGRAIQISKDICSSRGTANGSVCLCTEAVEVLLEAKCPIRPYYDFAKRNIFGMLVFFNLLIGASRHCKALLAEELQMRQRDLEEFAPRTLLLSENLRSSATQFDVRSIEIDTFRQNKATAKFRTSLKAPPGHISSVGTKKHIFRPIWLDITCPEDASILEPGFH
jgi:hypothetical protein